MILQALKEYYDRKPDLPRDGWEWKEIPFIVVLDARGNPVSLNSTVEGTGKAKRAKSFLVPQGVKKTSGIASNLLWENPEYALGVPIKGDADSVRDRHEAFKQRIGGLRDTFDSGLLAVNAFMNHDNKASLLEPFGEAWTQLLEKGSNLTFQLAGEPDIVVNSCEVKKAIDSAQLKKGQTGSAICLVSGEEDVIERLHSAIKGVWGAQTSGANIVSFNSEAFSSYGKKQGDNAPVGEVVAFAYTTALNSLLGKDSKQRMQVGDASTVFWSEKATVFEQQVVDFFGEPPKDDPDRNTRAIESLFRAPATGALPDTTETTRFYALGLAPNASRISVRFWMVDTVAGMAGKIRQHFDDLLIVHGPKDKNAISLFRLLVCIASLGKADNIPPNLAGDTMRAILQGLPYPQTLLQAAIRRIRAEHEISFQRAALIKACINRKTRFANPNIKEELKVSLDTTNINIGYRLGRLFATLEKIQGDAQGNTNATIRDRFYGAASGTPSTVFGSLMRLKNHHLAKLSDGLRVARERQIGEIVGGILDFPAHLNLEDQGRFAIGYYHQMQDFYTKKSDKE
jgi:CRISPR-associated protein Csd1